MFTDLRLSLFLAIRFLKRSSKTGTFLTIFIIALVFTNMIFLSAVIGGSIELMNQQTVDYYTSNIVVKPPEEERFIQSTNNLLTTINRVPGVAHSSARYELAASLVHKSHELSLPVIAFRPEDEKQVTRIHEVMKEGQFLTKGDQNEIIIGNYVAGHIDESMDLFESLGGVKTGDLIQIRYVNGVQREYRIKGIFQTKSYQTDYKVFITWDEMERVLGSPVNESAEILVKTHDGVPENRVKLAIMSYGIREDVRTWVDQTGKILAESLESFEIINNITILVSLIIAVVVLFIIIMIKTLHSRREIGILKAIGIDESIIVRSYVLQTLFIAVIGVAAGLCIVECLSLYFGAYPIRFPDGDVSLHIETGILLESGILLILASIVAGYLPASRIAGEKILTAMRG